ncbi:DUF3631 domain-containing protein [Spongiibacter nanhainus]|uniref:DUF3631 domain-containing protein n=1 Tax=Spongiibacter nanhainus TaxID=2794344 RepID=A0A7T4USQ9_9GAMM|nr:DUF3631 domain-containing protein [Spongiibacter nanhainus]QQD19685.1 DUF3631 domain-containing protein [Spongiibacter nanhainus]
MSGTSDTQRSDVEKGLPACQQKQPLTPHEENAMTNDTSLTTESSTNEADLPLLPTTAAAPDPTSGEHVDIVQEGQLETADAAILAPPKREFPEGLVPWHSPVTMAKEADDITEIIKKYCVLRDEEVDAIVLWVIASYLINSFRVFGKLFFQSPVKRCGKTTTMEVVSTFAKDCLMTSNISAAVMFRVTRRCQPTIFLDEADSLIRSADSDLINILNSGHTKSSAYVMRCTGDDHTPKAYSTWMPVALGSIGALPTTVMDRSIVINLRRKLAHEVVSKPPENLATLNKIYREKLLRWCIDNKHAVEQSTVEAPNIGNDRAADNWDPLFKVAEIMGADWGLRCEAAYKAITVIPEPDAKGLLLQDIQAVWASHKDDRIASKALVDTLCGDPTKPWSTFSSGKSITQNKVASMLSDFGIRPKDIRFPEIGTRRGYEREQFTDAFARYNNH